MSRTGAADGRRRGRALVAVALAAALASSATGCSWVLVSRPPSDSPESVPNWSRRTPDCTTGRIVPILDTTAAAASGVAGTVLLATQPSDSKWKTAAPLVLWTAGVVFAVSAIDGFKAVDRCRAYRSAIQQAPAPPPSPK